MIEHDMPVVVTRNRFGYNVKPKDYSGKGVFLRRVTTNLNGLPKPALTNWAANTVAGYALANHSRIAAMLNGIDTETIEAAGIALLAKEELKSNGDTALIDSVYNLLRNAPWEKRDAAGDRGTAIHAAIESFIANEPLPDVLTTEDELDCAIAAETFLKERGAQVLAVELSIVNLSFGYAGTLDMWDLKDGRRAILDWKSSGGIYTSHAVQQIAYKHGEFAIVDKTPLPTKGKTEAWQGRAIAWGPDKVDDLGIVHVTPEGAYLYPILPDAERLLWDTYRAARHIYQFQSDTDDYRGPAKRPVFGDALTYQLTQSLAQ